MERRCPCCGSVLRVRARTGRLMEYRGMQLELPADIPLLECDGCGERIVGTSDAENIYSALEPLYQKAISG